MDTSNNNDLNDENELPKLSIEEENTFKKLKMSIEMNTVFPKNLSNLLPPEIEGAFLDGLMKFEKMYRNAKRITIFKKIGEPRIKSSSFFSDDAIDAELKKLVKKLNKGGISFRTQYEYDSRLIYDFIKNELFFKEVDDLQMEGLILHFEYEDFYPNYEEELKKLTVDYLTVFFDKASDAYSKDYATEAKNHQEINVFRDLFESFTVVDLKILDINFYRKNKCPKVHFTINYKAKITGSKLMINYHGKGFITFKSNDFNWKIRKVSLPKNEIDPSK